MALTKYLLFVLKSDNNENLVIERQDKYGGNKEYKKYEDLEKDFQEKKIHPLDLKNAVTKEINKLLKFLREDKEIHKLHKEAYSF